ncbi:MAG TPA: cupin domain-containing protein [bacterium]|nr:cupin domain-containing protein [bacterium]HPR87759.1 cupin domain-containing protein [bacterium]
MAELKWLEIAALALITAGPLRPQPPADSTYAPAKRYDISRCVNHFDKSKTVATSVGYQYWFVDRTFVDGRTLKLSVVAPGCATHEPHRHVEDEFFFILAGKAEFFLEGEKGEGGPLTSFYCPSEMLHGLRNAGSDTLKYLVIKKYPAEVQ